MGRDIYLDNAASTPITNEVAERLARLYQQPWGNAASQHRTGRQALAACDDAREQIKALCLGNPDQAALDAWQIVITSGGTEANNLAIHGLSSPAAPVLVSGVEHPSVLSCITESASLRRSGRVLPVNAAGQIKLEILENWLQTSDRASGRPLVSIMAGNNETGILSNIDACSAVCRAHGAILHCDAVQWVGKVPMDPLVGLVDAFSISAHKFHGPTGIGGLVYRSSLALRPLLYGGGQQLTLRPGTESVPLLGGMAAALSAAERDRASGAITRMTELQRRFESGLAKSMPAGPIIVAAEHRRLPHISLVAFPGLDRQALLMALDLAGIQCSSGSACASGSSQPSHVLTAMQLPLAWIRGAIRFSFSHLNTSDEIDESVDRISRVVAKMQAYS